MKPTKGSREVPIKYPIVVAIAALLLLSFSSSFASEATYEQHVAKGVLFMEERNYRAAKSEFESALSNVPGDFTATLYLGIAQSRSADRDAEATLKKALSLKPGDARAALETGIYYFNRGAYKTSVDYFNRALASAPEGDLSAVAKEYLQAAAYEGGTKPWTLNVAIGGQYDTNVILNATGGPLPEGISGKSDWRAVLYLKGRYDFVRTERTEASASYSLYQSLHARLSDFNVSDHLLDVRATYALFPRVSLRGVANLEYTFLGGNDYDSVYSLSPAVIVSEGNGFSTLIEYIYKKSHFINSDVFFNNSERSGPNNLIGITQDIPLCAALMAKVGYAHDVDSTGRDFWSYRGDKLLAVLQFTLPMSIYGELSGQYYHKNYKGPYQIPGDDREDRTYTASISFSKVLSQRFSITAGQLYERNKSNTPVFDYKRAITSLFLNARF